MSEPIIRPDLLPSLKELERIRQVAIGAAPADLIVRGGSVLSVHTGEFLARDVVISGRHIAAVTPVGRFEATTELDARGRSVVPTFIDAHLHIEYTLLTPGELGRLVVPKGTVSVLTDPDAMANVLGIPGMDLMRTTGTPLRIFEQVTPLTPAFPDVEVGGARIEEDVILNRLTEPESVTLGESSPFDYGTVATNRYREALLAGRRITGHTARLGGEALWGYLAGGVGDDHNGATAEEVLERVRLGAMLTLMAGSMNDNTESVFADIDAIRPAFAHMCFCADDKHVGDLAEQGHIDHHVRQAIRFGVPVEVAYRMATWNAALYYRIDQAVGALVPTRLADLQIIGDLHQVRPDVVMVGGQVVAEEGVALFVNPDTMPPWARHTVHLPSDFSADRLGLPADGSTAWVQAMEMYDGYFKRAFHVGLPVIDGQVGSDPGRDVLKVAVVDRHQGTGDAGLGFVKGFGLQQGALAVSTNCTSQNIVVVGVTDQDMVAAVLALQAMGGGFVVVADGEVRAAVPLPLGGVMSDQPWEVVYDQLKGADQAAAGLGCQIRSPFLILSFVGMPGVPDLGVTELGLVETASQTLAPLVLGREGATIACRCPSHGHPVHQLMDPATA